MTLPKPAASTWMAISLALAYVVAFWSDPIGPGVWSPLGPDMLHGDSKSFFLSSSSLRYRTLGYPFFVETVRIVFGTVEAAPRVQLVVMAASVVFMGWAVGRAASRGVADGRRAARTGAARSVFGGRRRTAAGKAARRLGDPWTVAVVALALAVSAAPRFHAYVLSEALFVPLACVATGFFALFLACPTSWRGGALSASTGLAAVARPSALFFVAAWPVALWLVWDRCKGRRWRLAVASVAPMLALLLAEDFGRQFVRNAAPSTQVEIMNRRLFAKASMTISEPVLPERIRKDAALANFVADSRASAAPLRELLQRAPDWRIRAVVLRQSEAAIEMPRYWRETRWRVADLAETRNVSGEALLGELALAMLLSRPGGWAADAFVQWRALWFLYSINDAGLAARYASLVEGLEGDPAFVEADLIAPAAVRPEPVPVVLASRLGAMASFLASVAIVVLCAAERLRRAPRERNADLMIGAVASVMVHAHMAGTSFLAQAVLRFAVATWPLQAVYCACMARWAVNRLAGRLRRQLPVRASSSVDAASTRRKSSA